MNSYTIKLKSEKQLFFKSIYNLKLIKLKTLITYLKINIINSFM